MQPFWCNPNNYLNSKRKMKSESRASIFKRKTSAQTFFTKVSLKKQGYSFICGGLNLIKSKVLPRYLKNVVLLLFSSSSSRKGTLRCTCSPEVGNDLRQLKHGTEVNLHRGKLKSILHFFRLLMKVLFLY